MLFDKIGCPIASLIFGGNGTPCIHIIDPYRERLTLRPRAPASFCWTASQDIVGAKCHQLSLMPLHSELLTSCHRSYGYGQISEPWVRQHCDSHER